MLTLECVGAVFVRQLEHQNLNTFKQTIELPSYVDNSLAEQLSRSNTKKANKQINQILSEVNNNNISEIRVVDSKSIVRGTSNADNRSAIGQKTTDQAIKATLLNNRSHTENLYDNSNHTRYYVNVIPLVDNSNNNVVGAVYLRASLESVYANINNITLVYLSAAMITIVLSLILAIIISQEITRPIEEMRKQTLRIARGDYSGQVKVLGNDELGQLAGAAMPGRPLSRHGMTALATTVGCWKYAMPRMNLDATTPCSCATSSTAHITHSAFSTQACPRPFPSPTAVRGRQQPRLRAETWGLHIRPMSLIPGINGSTGRPSTRRY